MISLTDLILSTVTAILFLLLGYLIIRSYMLSRDKIYLWFFTSVFIWPLIYAAISFSISGAKGLVKKGLENKIGGFGDYASVMLLLDDLTQGVKLVRLSISLMLVTNILFLVPFAILYHRLTKKT